MSTDNPATKNALVSEAIAKKFETEKATPYTRWVADEGLDINDSIFVPNLHTVELKPWARRGGKGVYLNHDASRTSNDCYVCEIPPGQQLAPQRQLFEEMIYVLDGRGSTTVSNGAGVKLSFEWKAGAIFAIPLNTTHQHFNGSGSEPARFVAVTNGPPIINAFGDTDFVFNTDYDFKNTLPARATTLPTAANKRACCSTPTSSPTRSTCHSSAPRSAAPAAATSASAWPRAA